MARAIIDPVTRIEGHLRVEAEVEGDIIKDAWVSGGLFRGMEAVMRGKEPADAFYITQRICGVCPVSHGMTSSMASEAAMGITVPENARLIRNLIEGAQFLHSHILWFYHLAALDYVDPVAGLAADVADTYALAEAAGTRTTDFGAVRDRLQAFADAGKMSIFTNAWFGHPAYRLPPELDLIATAHYLEALEMQAEASTIVGVMGGKMPHFMTCPPGGSTWVPTAGKLDDVLFRLRRIRDFVVEAMVPDTLAIAPYYLDAVGYGGGVGNFLAYGVFDEESRDPDDRALPPGVVIGDMTASAIDMDRIIEYVDHSYYLADSGNLPPSRGVTNPDYTAYDTGDKYSWVKAPRYDGHPMEVGGLARMLVAYLKGVPRVKRLIDDTLTALGAADQLDILISTLGRTASRNLEAVYVAEKMLDWIGELIANLEDGETQVFEGHEIADGDGMGAWEAPRGALLHYVDVKGGEIDRYQCVVPSTWNASPRDPDGVPGAMEEALIGCPVEDVERPLHALRTVHSFDPCIACGVHLVEPKTGRGARVVTSPWGVR